jgi:hypothetical protein
LGADDLIVLPNKAEFLPLLTDEDAGAGFDVLLPDLIVDPNSEEVAAGFLIGLAGVEVEVKLSQKSSTVCNFGTGIAELETVDEEVGAGAMAPVSATDAVLPVSLYAIRAAWMTFKISEAC